MSIGAVTIGIAPIAAHSDTTPSRKGGPPPKRTLIATGDRIALPEAR
jgi:hypothetical protein